MERDSACPRQLCVLSELKSRIESHAEGVSGSARLSLIWIQHDSGSHKQSQASCSSHFSWRKGCARRGMIFLRTIQTLAGKAESSLVQRVTSLESLPIRCKSYFGPQPGSSNFLPSQSLLILISSSMMWPLEADVCVQTWMGPSAIIRRVYLWRFVSWSLRCSDCNPTSPHGIQAAEVRKRLRLWLAGP